MTANLNHIYLISQPAYYFIVCFQYKEKQSEITQKREAQEGSQLNVNMRQLLDL